ncbi:MAG: alpha/beta hydrolase [Pseudomonadota bacterium]
MPTASPLTRLKRILKSNSEPEKKATEICVLADVLLPDAIDVLDDGLAGADPLVQVAIMDAYHTMTGDRFHKPDLENMMDFAASLGDAGEQLYMAARIALGNITGLSMDQLDEWGDGQLNITATARRRRSRRRRGRPARMIDEITIVIHGTWASDGTWWRPGGDFFDYVKNDLGRDDLYGKSDQFKWSGKNRDSKRRKAATELHQWLKGHPAREVNVFGHSHGANVAMLATHHDIRMDRLIMLSPPVRKDYFAKWSNVGAAFNVQAKFDPVVAIARGGQWFRIPEVSERPLKASGHSASHESKVWRAEKLPKFVGMPWQ